VSKEGFCRDETSEERRGKVAAAGRTSVVALTNVELAFTHTFTFTSYNDDSNTRHHGLIVHLPNQAYRQLRQCGTLSSVVPCL